MRTPTLIPIRAKLIARLLAMSLMLLTTIAAGARPGDGEQPVVVACDWAFAPYEYIDNEGASAGFNVDVLSAVFHRLGRTVTFVTNARSKSIEAFTSHEADLFVDYKDRFTGSPYVRSRSILDYYHFQVASAHGVPPVSQTSQLHDCGTIVLNGSNDSITRTALGASIEGVELLLLSPREALAGIASGEHHYFIWGKEPMNWKIKEYNLHGITLTPLNLPASEIHLVGYDRTLMDEIDDQLARMQQSGELDLIRDRWFHPDREQQTTSPLPIYITLAVVFIAALLLGVYKMLKRRVRAAVRLNEDMEGMMHQALTMGNYSVFVYSLRDRRVSNLHGQVLPDEGLTVDEFFGRIHPDDTATLEHQTQQMAAGRLQAAPFSMRWNAATMRQPMWIDVQGYTFAETDGHGSVQNIVITSRNVTDEVQAERHNRALGRRYRKMFDSTLVAMSFYGPDGMLIDLNENMKKLCGLTDESLGFFRNTSLFDVDLFKDDFDPASRENFHICQHMHYPEVGLDCYIEIRVRPIYEDDRLLYYIITARDVTDERMMYLELARQNKALQQTEETNRRYETEMRTLLDNCNMFVWHADLESGTIVFSRSLDKEEFTETIEDYVNGMYEEERAAALAHVKNLQAIKHTFNVVHHFHHTPVSDEPAWYAVSGMPLTDAQSHVTSFFGVVRDVTSLMEAQERLKEETARAENSGMLKSTFLANMTHEIRTPLNAIVGFSDILQMVDSPEERKEFIRIIRNNCDMLLRLINDIFEASTMDVKPLEIRPEEVDFASYFDVVSHSLAQRVQEPAVDFQVVNPYASFVTRLDKSRMQQVITNFVTNSVKYTHQGHIRVGYRYDDGGIYMYCEDTGAGIPKDKQKSVFDRFVKLNDYVQGTGLGLNICKAIAERSGGRIGVESEGDGHGSTFWIWVPCPVISQAEAPKP